MSRWFRLYSDLLDDPKCQGLGASTFKTWINLLCIASKNGGEIDEATVPFQLRMKPSEVRLHIAKLIAADLLDVVDNILKPHNWETRQWVSDDSKERVRRHRERRKKKRQDNGHGNDDVTVTVTPPYSTDSLPDGKEQSPLPNGKGRNGAHSEPPGSGADAPLEVISVPKAVTKVDADTSAYFKRGRQILEDRHDAGRLLAAILKNNNGNLNAARLAMERVACAASPLDYANRLANGRQKRDDNEDARRRNGDCF